MTIRRILVHLVVIFLVGCASVCRAAEPIPQATHGSPAKGTSASFTLWQLPNQTRTQMMSYVIQSHTGKVIVIDGGNAGDGAYLSDFLKGLGNTVDAWFISHPHSDHFDALCEILEQPGSLEIDAIYASMPDRDWVNKVAADAERVSFDRFNSVLAQTGRTIIDLGLGQEMKIDGVRIEVLGVKNPEIIRNPINNSSLVLRVSDGVKSVIFLGDLGVEGGEKLLNGPLADRLKSDYVQMAHHGQNGVSEAFYQRVAPAYCLWPTPEWLWENDNGGGKNSGPWRTLEVRSWMAKQSVKTHFLMFEGLHKVN